MEEKKIPKAKIIKDEHLSGLTCAQISEKYNIHIKYVQNRVAYIVRTNLNRNVGRLLYLEKNSMGTETMMIARLFECPVVQETVEAWYHRLNASKVKRVSKYTKNNKKSRGRKNGKYSKNDCD